MQLNIVIFAELSQERVDLTSTPTFALHLILTNKKP